MGINSTEVSYGFGQMGSIFSDGTGALTPPSGKVFVAITFLADTVFNSSNGLVADNDVTAGLEFIGTDENGWFVNAIMYTTGTPGSTAAISAS